MKKALTLAFFVYVASFLAYGFQPKAYVGFTERADSSIVKKHAKLSRKLRKARKKLSRDTKSLKSGLAASGNSGKDSLILATKSAAKKADSLLRINVAHFQYDTLQRSNKRGADSLRKQGEATGKAILAGTIHSSVLGKKDSVFKSSLSIAGNLNKDSLAHKLKKVPAEQLSGKLSALPVGKDDLSSILQNTDSLKLGEQAK